jgi:hypothetical protein
MDNELALRRIAREITEEITRRAPFAVGDTVKHPSGRFVTITSGQYWGAHGLSNFWYWKEVLADGTLGPEEHGYGWARVD